MFKTTFSGVTLLCVSLVLCAKVGSAQACQSGANGFYAYSAIGTGVPGALLTPSAISLNNTYSATPVGQLLSGIANTGPFAASGSFYLDGSGNIRASSATQGGTTMFVGTYVVNSDCTIAVTLTDAFGTNKTAATLQGIILANGSEIDLGMLQNTSTGSTTALGALQSNLLIRLIRPLATFCSISNLNGSYALIATGTKAATVAASSGTTILPAQTVASFFMFGRVQFDANGGITPQTATASSLSSLQFAGSYTVNSDCTGTMTLGSNTSAGALAPAGPTLSLNFILTPPSVPSTSMRPDIQFNLSNGTQTLFGRGQAQ